MRCEIVAGMPPFSWIIACIAQLVEHMTFNHVVTGSIPAARIASKRRNTFHFTFLLQKRRIKRRLCFIQLYFIIIVTNVIYSIIILPPFTTLISKIINNVFGHRGLLHYSLFWIVMAFFTANYNHFTQGLFFAVFGHLFLDACTYKGIPALSWIIDRNKSFYVFPKKWKMYVGKRRTNNVFYIFTAFVISGIIFLTMH